MECNMANFLHSSPTLWTTDNVCTWLSSTLNLPQYCQKFEELAIDGLVLYDIQDDDLLNDFGINIRLHRLKILEGIKQLKAKYERAQETPISLGNTHNINENLKTLLHCYESLPDYNDYPLENIHPNSLSNTHRDNVCSQKNHSNTREREITGQDLSKILVLKVMEGSLYNNIFILGVNGATLGRHSGSNDIVISESFVSRRHCNILYENNSFWIQDLGSTTGTFLLAKETIDLKEGKMFQMGLTEIRVMKINIGEGTSPSLELEVFEGPYRGKTAVVTQSGFSIGRVASNSLAVQEDTQMSSFHAKITINKVNNKVVFRLVTLSDTNRTWIRLSSEGERSIPHKVYYGDVIKAGNTVFFTEKLDLAWLKGISKGEGNENSEKDRSQVLLNKTLVSLLEKKTKIKGGAEFSLNNGVCLNFIKDKDSDMCKICFVRNAEVAFVPCGHFAVCEQCAVKCEYCPFCKKSDVQIMKIFKS